MMFGICGGAGLRGCSYSKVIPKYVFEPGPLRLVDQFIQNASVKHWGLASAAKIELLVRNWVNAAYSPQEDQFQYAYSAVKKEVISIVDPTNDVTGITDFKYIQNKRLYKKISIKIIDWFWHFIN